MLVWCPSCPEVRGRLFSGFYCPVAGLVAGMSEFDESERLIWSGRARAFAESFARVCAYPVEDLLEAAGARAGVWLLDVGTGSGSVAVTACGRGAQVTAIDAEPDMVELASKAAPLADVRVATLPVLPFADDVFDVVTANFVLNHVGRPRRALAELRRVARPGGRIAMTIWAVPHGAGQALLGRAVEAAGGIRPAHLLALAPEDYFARTEQGLANLFRDAGLTGVSCRTIARWEGRQAGASARGPARQRNGLSAAPIASRRPCLRGVGSGAIAAGGADLEDGTALQRAGQPDASDRVPGPVPRRVFPTRVSRATVAAAMLDEAESDHPTCGVPIPLER
jgi:SAM-dependent methyltransferase